QLPSLRKIVICQPTIRNAQKIVDTSAIKTVSLANRTSLTDGTAPPKWMVGEYRLLNLIRRPKHLCRQPDLRGICAENSFANATPISFSPWGTRLSQRRVLSATSAPAAPPLFASGAVSSHGAENEKSPFGLATIGRQAKCSGVLLWTT